MSLIWRPFSQMKQVAGVPEVTRAKNSLLFLKKGQSLIDAISSWWLITHGHCHPPIVKAIQQKAPHLDQVLFANFTHQKAEKLVKELSSLLPKKLNRFFFSDNGSTAVEVSLKMALQSMAQRGFPERKEFLSFKNSYHGDTVGAMSVSARGIFTKAYKDLLFTIHSCQQGHFSFDSEKSFYQDFERQLEKHKKTLCAVIIEPLIQGAGGMIIWPPKALERICQLAQSAGIYVIFDEIMTGFGRTGTVFALDQIKSQPDILCLSKGLTAGAMPLALTISTNAIYQDFLSSKKEKALLHGHSWTGNPLACSVALANIQTLKKNKQKLLKKWQSIENLNKERLSGLKKSRLVQDLRAKGLIAVVQTQSTYSSQFAEKITKKAMQKGVFLRPLGGTIYTLVPYCITQKELHKVWDVIETLIPK